MFARMVDLFKSLAVKMRAQIIPEKVLAGSKVVYVFVCIILHTVF